MSNKIFLDSNFLIALNNAEDNLHYHAIEKALEIDKQNMTLVISNYIFLETVTVLAQRTDKKNAIRVGKKLKKQTNTKLIHISQGLHQQSWKIFCAEKRKNLSFVDSSILAVMKKEQIFELLSFDYTDFGPLQKKYKFQLFA